MLESLEDKILPSSDNEEFMNFLNSLTKEVDMNITQSKNISSSSSSSSGSSNIRMLQHSPDSPDSVQPDTDTCRTHGNSLLERTLSHSLKENTGFQLPDDESHQQSILRVSGSASQVDCSQQPIQALPEITTVINS